MVRGIMGRMSSVLITRGAEQWRSMLMLLPGESKSIPFH
jgi:hypothetical protein